LRDLDAVMRSLESQQVQVSPLNFASLTGRTPFEEVRGILARLEHPEDSFDDRIHVITASSMMSHGVDINRLNVLVMLGLPLATAEFIQTTARVGRRWPGLVFVLHKIARERDASVFRSFAPFVTHGDRFVEPVPITRRSRRVLERTIAGLQLARILHIHEPASTRALTTTSRLREYFREIPVTREDEFLALVKMLGLADPLDGLLRADIQGWMNLFFENLEDPAGSFRFPADLSPTGGPMISLRDVEELAPVRD
jgi:Helicase conserved C-terminal domain